jgi:serine/threonine protein kinase
MTALRYNPPTLTPQIPNQDDQPTTGLVSPSVSYRYDILGELGSGGMGVVYKARDRETGAVVAVKVLRAEIASRRELIERFKTELLLARKITHKNVCRVYDLNRFDNVAVISMEYIEGQSLRALLDRPEGISVRYGLKIIQQVIAGLGEAHAQGVIHRDLKPENILLARDGTVKVMDFGIARSIDTDATLTGAISGTPAYMSPEQAGGKEQWIALGAWALFVVAAAVVVFRSSIVALHSRISEVFQ